MQEECEKALLHLANYAKKTGKRKLCISGGVGLNSVSNNKIRINKPKIANDFFLKGINFGEDKIIINNLLNSCILLRDLDNSDLYFKKAEKIDENFLDFKYNKARYLILKNQIDEAIKILEHNKDIAKFLITLLILYSNLNKKDDRDKLLMTHKDRIKNDHKFYNYLALTSLYDGNFEDGWKYYEYRNSKTVDFFNTTPDKVNGVWNHYFRPELESRFSTQLPEGGKATPKVIRKILARILEDEFEVDKGLVDSWIGHAGGQDDASTRLSAKAYAGVVSDKRIGPLINNIIRNDALNTGTSVNDLFVERGSNVLEFKDGNFTYPANKEPYLYSRDVNVVPQKQRRTKQHVQ